jgi:uncharacterized protein (DUF1330 family)
MGSIEEFHDPATMNQYVEQVAPVVPQYGGPYVFVGGKAEAIEGDVRPAILAAVEFADMAHVRAFWDSPGHAAVTALRHRSTWSNVFSADAPALA